MAPRRSAASTGTVAWPWLRLRSGPGMRNWGNSELLHAFAKRLHVRVYFYSPSALRIAVYRLGRLEAVPGDVRDYQLIAAPAPGPGELGQHSDRDTAGGLREDALGPGQQA